MQVQEKLTAEDLWELSRDGKRRELVRGAIIEKAPMGDIHGAITAWLTYLIVDYVETHATGEVTGAETGFRLSTDPDTVRAPDVAVIRKERLTPMTGKYYPLAPDLAVEVVSPGDTAGDIHEKVRDFLQAGTRLLWVVYPSSRTVVVHTPAGAETLESSDTLDGGEVLPGLSLPVGRVFEKLRL
jgi:Uma2 family endonuclease